MPGNCPGGNGIPGNGTPGWFRLPPGVGVFGRFGVFCPVVSGAVHDGVVVPPGVEPGGVDRVLTLLVFVLPL